MVVSRRFVVALLALCVANVVDCKVIGSYDGTDSYADGTGSDYNSGTKCSSYQETVYEERCEQYSDRTCYTTQEESCVDVEDQNCRGIVSSKQVRQCFDVNELICGLKEDIQYETVNAVFTVQKCHKVNERVCDTVYEPRFTAKDDFQCINVNNPSCSSQERQVLDKICKTVTNLDCNTDYVADMGSGMMVGPSSRALAAVSGGSGAYGGQGYDASVASGYADSGASYNYEPKCTRSQDVKCYTTPRTVSSQVCSNSMDKICEKLTERVPVPSERQVCHNEDKKVCELEQRQQPKQVKNYVYTKQCKTVPRKVCENAEVKELVPSCVPVTRKQCSYSPRERCEEVPKQHCYKVPRVVTKQKCEAVQGSSYPQQADPSYN